MLMPPTPSQVFAGTAAVEPPAQRRNARACSSFHPQLLPGPLREYHCQFIEHRHHNLVIYVP
eukprot:5060156-Pyramimonas_sp.AAC.1